MYRIFLFLLLVVAFFSSCSNRSRNPNLHLQLSDFEALNTSDYALNSHRIHHYLEQVALWALMVVQKVITSMVVNSFG